MIGLAMLMLFIVFGGGTFFAFKYRSMLMGAIQRGSERAHQSIQHNPVVRHAERLGTRGITRLIKEWGPLVEGALGLRRAKRIDRDITEGFKEVESDLHEVQEEVASSPPSLTQTLVITDKTLESLSARQLRNGGIRDSSEPIRLVPVGPDTWGYPGTEIVQEGGQGEPLPASRPAVVGPQVRPPWADSGSEGGSVSSMEASPEESGARGTFSESVVPEGGMRGEENGEEKAPTVVPALWQARAKYAGDAGTEAAKAASTPPRISPYYGGPPQGDMAGQAFGALDVETGGPTGGVVGRKESGDVRGGSVGKMPVISRNKERRDDKGMALEVQYPARKVGIPEALRPEKPESYTPNDSGEQS
ncbi:MAG: hypothetical protein ACPLSY_03235 [Moorellaceae bacterium]